ncbi:MAG TPA: serine/threonine protein kinase, partial [Streptomyces sp.]|nr:serine/threonine protein kinase [Streptomyces sp.]
AARRPAGSGGGPRPVVRRPVPSSPHLLRQRLVVFVTVTLLVALGIAAAQGCQGSAHGLEGSAVTTVFPGSPAPRPR